MNKQLSGLINIKDVKQLSTYTDEDILAYKIINNVQYKTNGTELRGAPLSTPIEELSYSKPIFNEYSTDEDLVVTDTITITDTNAIYTYEDSYIKDNKAKVHLTNPQTVSIQIYIMI